MFKVTCKLYEFHKTDYSYEYDAYFCCDCDDWLEKKCEDHRCNFCPKRPDKPSQV